MLTDKELITIIGVDSMKHNIKHLGQQRTQDIINGGRLVLTADQRRIYQSYFLKAVHEMEDAK